MVSSVTRKTTVVQVLLGLATSLVIVGAFNLWGAVHCLAATRTLRAELARSSGQ